MGSTSFIGFAYKQIANAASGEESSLSLAPSINKAAGDYVGLKLNVTETLAPGTNNRLLDLQVGGVSKANVNTSGDLTVGSTLAFTLRADGALVGNGINTRTFAHSTSYLSGMDLYEDHTWFYANGASFLMQQQTAGVNILTLQGDRSATIDSNGDYGQVLGTTSTSNATATAVASYLVPDNKSVIIMARVTGRKTDGTQAAGYVRSAAFRRSGATTTQVGTTASISTFEDDAAWDATIDVDSGVVRVMVTGVALTVIDWRAQLEATVLP
jgi:hypothetical protein